MEVAFRRCAFARKRRRDGIVVFIRLCHRPTDRLNKLRAEIASD
jgi:hypothetical protein